MRSREMRGDVWTYSYKRNVHILTLNYHIACDWFFLIGGCHRLTQFACNICFKRIILQFGMGTWDPPEGDNLES
jgi:hypothetical protein